MTRRGWGLTLGAMLPAAVVAGCGQAVPCGELADAGPALAEVCADGVLTCDENCSRNQYNVCPASMPGAGLDENGVTWTPDLIFGLPNPYHTGAECWRGSAPVLGISSYQCCYQDGRLVTEGENAGSFDFVDPFQSPETLVGHTLLDVVPFSMCACE